MNNDHELLELAAKAAGMNHLKPQINFDAEQVFGCWWDRNAEKEVWWNPLTDDGDALRLAVKLGLNVEVSKNAAMTSIFTTGFSQHETHDTDPYAATRRAIVRAAADVGKGKK